MPNTTGLTENLIFSAQSVIRNEERARKALAKGVTEGMVVDSYLLRPVLIAQATAVPWRKVAARIEQAGAVEALRSVREECMEFLTERSETQSTCAITNESDRLARDAARDFLRTIRSMRVDAQA
ncbi:hypothetical protein ACIA7S_28730 [Streptomyces sp. NPDC051643]|uniref:hypothetical protein n=1 Tax=Streptomyces sp. NPDC051643 TaxID=3365665 RepID=UPI0037A4A35B